MTTTADLPNGHYVMAALDHTTSAAVPHDDPLAPLARRWLNGKRAPGDRGAIEAWLEAHPQFRITRLPTDEIPAPVSIERRGQLTLFDAA